MSNKWFRAASIRAIKTVAQTVLASIGAATVINEVDWKYVLSASVMSGILSMLTSVRGLPEVKEDEK